MSVPCAGRCPQLVAANVSMLIGHLGGKAYSLRSSIVTALGHLVHKAFKQGPGEDADAQGMPLLCYYHSCPITSRVACLLQKKP